MSEEETSDRGRFVRTAVSRETEASETYRPDPRDICPSKNLNIIECFDLA
jgi:hypothetical protein